MSNKRRKCGGPLVPNITDYEEEFRKYNIQLNPNDVNDSKKLYRKCDKLCNESSYLFDMSFELVYVCELCKFARNRIASFTKCEECGVLGCSNCILYIKRITVDGLCYICFNKRVQRYNDKRQSYDFSHILQELKTLTYLPPELWTIVFYYAYCFNMNCNCNFWNMNKLF